MAETQEKRNTDPTSGNNPNTDVTNQTEQSTQSNTPNNLGADQKNSSTQLNADTSGASIDAKELLQQAKNTAGQAYDKVAEQASSQIVTQKDNLAHGLSSIADSIRQFGDNIRTGDAQQTPLAGLTTRYGDSLADQVEQLSDYLERKDLRDLVKDVEVFARRNPAIFIGGTFALGIVAARFLKSGNPNQALMRRPRRNRSGVYIPDESEGVYLPEDLSRKVGLTDPPRNFGTSATGNKTTGNSSTTDRTSSDTFSANKGG